MIFLLLALIKNVTVEIIIIEKTSFPALQKHSNYLILFSRGLVDNIAVKNALNLEVVATSHKTQSSAWLKAEAVLF